MKRALASQLGFVRRPLAGVQDASARRRSKQRILVWATLAALIVGVLSFAQPIEDYARMLRNKARQHPPSGQIVVVGIDEHSLEEIGAWPWPRARHAELIDRLKQAGARRIYFDVFFNTRSNPHDDRLLVDAIRRAGNVHLAASVSPTSFSNADLRPKLPLPMFAEHARLVSVAINYSGLSSIREIPYASRFGDIVAPSMSASLANVEGEVDETFPVDYAIDVNRVARVSASDVIDGTVPKHGLEGKDVVIAVASHELGDLYFMPGRGLVNGGFINVIAAETLREGRPTSLGWLAPLLIALALATIHLFTRRRWLGAASLSTGAFGVTGLPLIAEARHIVFDTMPALLLIGSVGIGAAWANFRQSYKVRGNINPVSGLPNLNALRDESVADDAVLVAARVRNFAEIATALPPDAERALVDQITARLALGARGARIYQGDEGVFAWVSTVDVSGPDQLDALYALFRSPALVDGRQIDLSVTFGIDAESGRTLANRIGATLVAADEAASEGLRWKAYDPAKLADAEWKLSLLGRLDAAIDSGEVWVAYQPQLDLATGQISGAEALVRWSHPDKGEVSPAEFVLAAEQHDRIDKLTAFVLSDAIKLAAAFKARGIPFDVAVNISARLLERSGLVQLVRDQLNESGLEPARLTLEVTESAALSSGRASIRTLEEIGSLGINVSIDDYGTGFSTLDYFKKIPATEVKIDRGFVAALDRNASDRLMVRSTVELAHSLGRTVVAEGVESSEILAELTKLGCDKAQGYLIAKPMKAAVLNRFILDHRRAHAA